MFCSDNYSLAKQHSTTKLTFSLSDEGPPDRFGRCLAAVFSITFPLFPRPGFARSVVTLAESSASSSTVDFASSSSSSRDFRLNNGITLPLVLPRPRPALALAFGALVPRSRPLAPPPPALRPYRFFPAITFRQSNPPTCP